MIVSDHGDIKRTVGGNGDFPAGQRDVGTQQRIGYVGKGQPPVIRAGQALVGSVQRIDNVVAGGDAVDLGGSDDYFAVYAWLIYLFPLERFGPRLLLCVDRPE